jgi:hypothetical protein
LVEAIWGIVGLLGGLLLSIGWWYILAHRFGPSLKFGEQIGFLYSASGEKRYRIKIVNAGRRRGIIDVSVRAYIRFPGVSLYPVDMPSNINAIKMLTSTEHIMRLKPKTSQVLQLKFAETVQKSLDEGELLIRKLYPVESQRATLTLESLLKRSHGAFVQIRVLCYDEWSGSRKYFESPKYGAADIAFGKYQGTAVVPTEQLQS